MFITEAHLGAYRRAYNQNDLACDVLPNDSFTWVGDHFDCMNAPPRPGVSEGEWLNVAIVFAFREKVPVLPSGRTWAALYQQAGGHACGQHYFIATEIFVHQELYGELRQIARDRWCWPGERDSHVKAQGVAIYRSELAKPGLCYSGHWLTEGIYPIDAVQTNLDILSEQPITLAELDVNDAEQAKHTGAYFLILAPNSDRAHRLAPAYPAAPDVRGTGAARYMLHSYTKTGSSRSMAGNSSFSVQ